MSRLSVMVSVHRLHHTYVSQTVEHELHGDGSEHQSHQAGEYANPGLSQVLPDAVRSGQYPVR